MGEPLTIVWSDEPHGNVEHIQEHDVTPEEAEFVIRQYFDHRRPSDSRPDRWLVHGYTPSGRYLHVVFEYLEDLDIAVPVTAYEPE